MKTLDSDQEKIAKIADLLRRQTLEPAEEESRRIIDQANEEAERIVRQAKADAEALVTEARQETERQRQVFNSSLQQATQQSLEALRQHIQKSLFSDELDLEVARAGSDPALISKLIEALIDAVSRDGTEADFTAVIPRSVSKEAVKSLLADRIVRRLKEGDLVLGDFAGGARVRLDNRHLILDMSDTALLELLRRYVGKEFRDLLFGASTTRGP